MKRAVQSAFTTFATAVFFLPAVVTAGTPGVATTTEGVSMRVDGAELVLRATGDSGEEGLPYITTTEEGLVMKVKGAELVLRPTSAGGDLATVTCTGASVEVVDGECVAKADPALAALVARAAMEDVTAVEGLAAALEAHYPLDDPANWVRDATGRGHDGVVVGGVVSAVHPESSEETVGACFPGTWAAKNEVCLSFFIFLSPNCTLWVPFASSACSYARPEKLTRHACDEVGCCGCLRRDEASCPSCCWERMWWGGGPLPFLLLAHQWYALIASILSDKHS
jgi:hypothetical protein